MAKRGRPKHPDILTPREWEVLALLREGLTNDQIAGRLGITERTAKYHVAEILGKLGLSSRREAAAWKPDGEDHRWWQAAAAPLLFWRKLPLGWLAAAAAGVTAIGVAAGAGLLVWGLVRTNGEGDGPAVVNEPGLYLIRPDGSGLRRLDEAGSAGNSFAWAPSGDRFVLAPRCRAEPKLFLGSAGDGRIETAAELPGDAGTIHWSPQEDSVATTMAFRQGTAGSAMLIDLESGDLTAIAGANPFYGWSHDGDRYAVGLSDPVVGWYDSGFAVVNAQSGERTFRGEGIGALWSPVADRLAVTRMDGPEEAPYNAWLASGIDVVRSDGTARVEILPLERHAVTGGASVIAWSPDGSRLLVKPYTSPFRYLVYDVDAPGQPLDLGESFKFSWGAWSPDGGRIAVERPDADIYIEVLSSDGTPLRQLRAGAAARQPAFSPDGQRIAFAGERSGALGADGLYVTDTDSGMPAMLASVRMNVSNLGWSADGSYIAFAAGLSSDGGCEGIEPAVDPPDELVWESADGRESMATLELASCGDADTAEAYGVPAALELIDQNGRTSSLGLEAEPYDYVPSRVVQSGQWQTAPLGWEVDFRPDIRWYMFRPPHTPLAELFLRRLDRPSLLFRYTVALCDEVIASQIEAQEARYSTVELPPQTPHIVAHRQGDFLPAQEVIDRVMARAPEPVTAVWAELGSSADFEATRRNGSFPPLKADRERVIWAVLLAYGDQWGPRRPGEEYGVAALFDASTGEGLGWHCCYRLETANTNPPRDGPAAPSRGSSTAHTRR